MPKKQTKSKSKKLKHLQLPFRPGKKVQILAGVAGVVSIVVAGVYAYAYIFVSAPSLLEPPLKDLAAARGVELGVLTYPNRLDNKPYTDVLQSQYGLATADGPIHWDTSRPGPKEFDFSNMDKVVAFADKHGQTVQGHHLLWDEDDSVPAWLKEGGYTREQTREFMRDHIKTVVGHYRGKVDAWTVVNEPFSRALHEYGLDSWWRDTLGGTDSYIDDAFRWAREADPDAKLILNEFNNETDTATGRLQFAYTKAALQRGVPIDGIGMQMHLDAGRPPSKTAMIQSMRKYAELGLPVYITEFDVHSNGMDVSDAEKAKAEARLTADAVRACIEARNCVSFTVFGLQTKQSLWEQVRGARHRAFLLDKRYQPTESYYAFREAWLRP